MVVEQVEHSDEKLSTGIDSIDRRLEGGIQSGSIVALLTPPTAQSHSLLQQVMKQRETVYITTLRTRESIENDLSHLSDDEMALSICEVGEAMTRHSNKMERLTGSRIHTINTSERDTLLDDINEVLDTIGDSVNVIIDPANPLERGESRTAYQNLLKSLSTTLIETNSIGLLHCTRLETPPLFRETTLTVADVVWELDVVSGRKNDLEIQTRIPKNRGGDAVLEKITLVIEGDTVYTDDSRNI